MHEVDDGNTNVDDVRKAAVRAWGKGCKVQAMRGQWDWILQASGPRFQRLDLRAETRPEACRLMIACLAVHPEHKDPE